MVSYLFQKGKYMTKKIGLSLVAATLLTSSAAMALEDTKVTGGVKLWYQSINDDAVSDDNFFGHNLTDTTKGANESGDLVLNLGVTAKATEKLGLGFKLYSATTLGLESNLVEGEAITNGSQNGGLNGDGNMPMWLGESYFTYQASSSNLLKIGRQELDTPLAYTEKWNAAPNTFEAAVLVNSSLPDTTVIAASVSRGNGFNNADVLATNTKTVNNGFSSYWGAASINESDVATDLNGDTDTLDTVSLGAKDKGGAYALGILNKSVESVPVNLWYYSVTDTASAVWVDAKIKMGDFGVDVIGASVTPTGITEELLDFLNDVGSTTATAAKVHAKFGDIAAYAAVSSVSDGNIPVANTATNFKKTKLPTASIFSDGMYAAQPGTTSTKVGASMGMGEASKLAVSYGMYQMGDGTSGYAIVGSGAHSIDTTTSEIDVVFKTKLDDLNLAAMYINQANYNAAEDTRQVIRIIAGIDF